MRTKGPMGKNQRYQSAVCQRGKEEVGRGKDRLYSAFSIPSRSISG